MPTTTPAAIPAVFEPPFLDFSESAELVPEEVGTWVMMTVVPGATLVMTVALPEVGVVLVLVTIEEAAELDDEEEEDDEADDLAAADDELDELDEPPP